MTRMFQKIQDLIDDKDALVFVLIDEVGVLRRHTCERRKHRTGWPSALLALPARACPAPQAAPCRPSLGASQALRAVFTRPRVHPADHPVTLCPQVESLTAARNACRAGTEPSDAIRVVNAVLTQIDQIKRYPCTLTAPASPPVFPAQSASGIGCGLCLLYV